MPPNEVNLLSLTGGVTLKPRVQHPRVQEYKGRHPYWYFRYWDDQCLPDGSVKSTRKRHIIGPSKDTGKGVITKNEAKSKRDAFFQKSNAPAVRAAAENGVILFKEAAQMYIDSHLSRRNKIAEPTRQSETSIVNSHLIKRWGDLRLTDIRPKEIEDWLYASFDSWWTMRAVRKVMGAIYRKAERWGYWDDSKKIPLTRVDIGRKCWKFARRILSEEETARVLDRLLQPNLLICEICVMTGTRISEVLGLQLRHVDLSEGTISIEQRNWHGDIGEPKTRGSRRILAIGDLGAEFEWHIAKLQKKDPGAWFFPQETDILKPLWDSGVRKALKQAASDEGLDFPGFGLHSLRRANISWRQKHGGASSIEASKLAGHASVEMTNEYTFVDLERQRETTSGISARLADARAVCAASDAERDEVRARLAKARAAKAAKRKHAGVATTPQAEAVA
jgi:integrase